MDSDMWGELKPPIGEPPAPNGLNVVKLLQAANVRRFHTVPIIGEQNIGHHSHRVCLVLRYLLDGQVPAHMYEAALFHDLPESAVGDIPAPVRWSSDRMANLLDEQEMLWAIEHGTYITLCDIEDAILAVADKLELVWFCTEQMLLGNRNMERVRDRGIEYCLRDHDIPDSVIDRVKSFIVECINEC